MRVIDLSGKTFGRLAVISRNGSDDRGQALWLCSCSCGSRKTIRGAEIRRGKAVSCGCLRMERLKSGSPTHGMTGSPTWSTWRDMRKRCSNPKAQNFKHYGGRGIKVCERWQDFSAFLEDMGQRPDGTSIERIDVNGGYEPGNCIWLPSKEQPNNTRRSIMVELDGENVCLKVACNRLGVSYSRARDRIRTLGWSIEDALNTPKKISATKFA